MNEAEQQVLGADVVVVQHPGFFLSQDHHPPCPIGKPLKHAPFRPSKSGGAHSAHQDTSRLPLKQDMSCVAGPRASPGTFCAARKQCHPATEREARCHEPSLPWACPWRWRLTWCSSPCCAALVRTRWGSPPPR